MTFMSSEHTFVAVKAFINITAVSFLTFAVVTTSRVLTRYISRTVIVCKIFVFVITMSINSAIGGITIVLNKAGFTEALIRTVCVVASGIGIAAVSNETFDYINTNIIKIDVAIKAETCDHQGRA